MSATGNIDPATDTEYVAARGARCPVCRSTDIQAVEGFETHDDGRGGQVCACDSCNAEWTDVYELVGYIANEDTFPNDSGEHDGP